MPTHDPRDVLSLLGRLSADLPAVQEEASRAAAEVAAETFEGTAADGRIVARVTGLGVVTEVTIGELARRGMDNLSLGDAVTEAVRAGEDAGRRALRERMAGLTIGGRPLSELAPFDRE
ncbi:YbaB/EbfC family nucleoid-associated protein [Dactylosporangium sp. AC04546]|uniref:YbaB/EbfC family nucleoid-associated protein n=1 Tax=Dactylosporangium sp. AC04546 TaxID=2862460 RepID=UPI001EDF01A4|nr:YbaB/EbfC family nucleoid-associated protein [Dactylosporangium sp. AC04546]WVK78823.1 YbaB/EbfC family nucleoid-associated protein [Dactylosporangium sp. AC04546]